MRDGHTKEKNKAIMKKNKQENEYSLLNTNSATAPFEEEAEPRFNKKQIWQTVGVFMIAAALLAGILIVGGIASERMHQKQLLREPDESMTAFYNEASQPETVEGTVQSLVTEAYYTNEKGLMVSLCFSNGLETDQHLTKIAVTIRDKDESGNIIAQGNTDKIDKKYEIKFKKFSKTENTLNYFVPNNLIIITGSFYMINELVNSL